MIIVIADDITGAAELAGIGLRYGLRVKLAADVKDYGQIDLLVLYSNTRSATKEEAVEEMTQLTMKACALNPLFVYKKTDSVLRGHVLAELSAQMKVLGLDKALLVPVNPGLGRTIENGSYFINGQPLHETSFSGDPEFPAKTPVVKELLGVEILPVSVIKPGSPLSDGVNVGEAKTQEDVQTWARYQQGNILLAGGGFFFDVLLAGKYDQVEKPGGGKVQYPVLFVSGTAFRKGDNLKGMGNAVSYMPEKLFYDEIISADSITEWSDEIVKTIKEQGKVYAGIGEKEKGDSQLLRLKIARTIKNVFDRLQVGELIIEGGSTAYSSIEALGWKQFTPQWELSFGVVKLKVDDATNVFLTIKPGSYPWPPSWDFKINNAV